MLLSGLVNFSTCFCPEMIRGTDPDETDFFSAKMGRVRCDKCEHEADSPETLQKHVDVVHDMIMEFMCDHCEFVTAYTADLEAHVKREHSGGEEDSQREAVHIGYKAYNSNFFKFM